ncbi:MAG: hypothetical protein RSA27_03595 [Oscillospiraceae bacterium]
MNERCGKTHGRNFSCERENSIKAANEAAAVKDAECEECECKRRRGCEFSCPVCINTEQIYDACRDRDCVTDRRVYFTGYGQEIIDKAINVKPKSAEIIWVDSDVESVPFNKGYYAVDIKYFICITFDVYKGVSCPTEVKGLTTFDKRVILFGSEGSTKSFESTLNSDCNITDEWQKTNLPKAIVTAVDQIV